MNSAYSVSLVYDKYINGNLNNKLECIILYANNKDEALGTAMRLLEADFKDSGWSLSLKVVLDISGFIKELRSCDIVNLKEVRLKNKLTLRQVEKATGISNAYLSQLENGKIKKPSHEIVQKLNEFYAQ